MLKAKVQNTLQKLKDDLVDDNYLHKQALQETFETEVKSKFDEMKDASEALVHFCAKNLALEKRSVTYLFSASKINFWLKLNSKYLLLENEAFEDTNDIHSTQVAQQHIERMDTLHKEIGSLKDTVFGELQQEASSLELEGYPFFGERVQPLQAHLESQIGECFESIVQKKEFLDLLLEREIKIVFLDDKSLDYLAKASRIVLFVDTYHHYLEKSNEEFISINDLHSIQTATEHTERMNALLAEILPLRDLLYTELKEEAEQLVREKDVFENKKVFPTQHSLEARVTSSLESIMAKKALLEQLLELEMENDDLCKKYAGKVQVFTQWISATRKETEKKDVPLKEQLEIITKVLEAKEGDEIAEQVSEMAAALEKRNIKVNIYSNVELQDVTSQLSQYMALLVKKKDLLEREIEINQRGGLSEEQNKEIKDNFEYYDKDSSGQLDKREMRSCLRSLGEDSTKEKMNKIMGQYDKDNDGKITYEEFKEFMKEVLGDTSTKTEILEAFNLLAEDSPALKEDLMRPLFKTEEVEFMFDAMEEGKWKEFVDAVFER